MTKEPITLRLKGPITLRRKNSVPEQDRTREHRLRRLAKRRGYILQKSKRRDPYAIDYGRWWIVEPDIGGNVAGGQFGITLDEVEEILTNLQDEE